MESINLITKIGVLEIESHVVVAEFKFSPPNGFSNFGKGRYFIKRLHK
jgi:hypothetical protein